MILAHSQDGLRSSGASSRQIGGLVPLCSTANYCHVSALSLPEQLFVFLAETTPAQQRFLEALAEVGVEDPGTPEYGGSLSAPPQRYEFDGVTDELRTAAQWARQHLQASPDARIGVLLLDLDRRLPQVESTFRAVLHPEQLLGQHTQPAFEIASPLALAEYPVVRCALQLLSLVAGPLEYHSFHSALSSPYIRVEPESVSKFLAEITKHAHRQVTFEELTHR